MESIALFDMDGTLCDYVRSMLIDLEKLMAPGEEFVDPFILRDDPKYQYLWNRIDLIKSDPEWWANLPKFSLGFEVMDMAIEVGYVPEVLTQSPEGNPAALAGKLKWIMNNLDPGIDYTMTRNKSRHYGRVLVDDFPGYAVPWLEYRKSGLVVMPTNDYNRDFSHPRVIRYDGKNKDEVREGLIRTLK